MKYLRILFLFYVLSSNLYSRDHIKVGILYEKIFTTKTEVKIGLKLWAKQMEKKKYDYYVDVILYEDKNKLIADYKNKKILSLVLDTTSYYENKEEIDAMSSDIWAVSKTSSVFQQFYLVKNIESKISLDKFDVKKIFYKENMSRLWLESLFLKKNMSLDIETYEKIEKANKLVFNVFFNKNSISLMTRDLYDSMTKLNPQIKLKLKVLEKSKKIFFDAIGFSRKDINENFKKTLDLIETDVNTNKNEFEAISFTEVKQIFSLKENDLKELDNFYKEYNYMKKNK